MYNIEFAISPALHLQFGIFFLLLLRDILGNIIQYNIHVCKKKNLRLRNRNSKYVEELQKMSSKITEKIYKNNNNTVKYEEGFEIATSIPYRNYKVKLYKLYRYDCSTWLV